MRVLLWWPGASYATADVAAGLARGLETAGVEVHHYATGAHIGVAAKYLRAFWQATGRQAPKPTDVDVLYQAAVGVLERAFRVNPDWIVIVSGRDHHPDIVAWLRRAGFRLALVCTESPYELAGELGLARLVHHVSTHERSVLDLFRRVCPSVSYLPHGYHPDVHTPAAGADTERDVPAHDVVFVGTGFTERIALLEGVDWSGINLGLYGSWDLLSRRSPLRAYVRGQQVPNVTAAALYRRAAIGLNLHRTSQHYRRVTLHAQHAESLNPRAYELAACGLFYVSDWRPELPEVFGPTVPTVQTSADLERVVRRWLRAPPDARAARAEAMRARVAAHDWVTRVTDWLQTMPGHRAAA